MAYTYLESQSPGGDSLFSDVIEIAYQMYLNAEVTIPWRGFVVF